MASGNFDPGDIKLAPSDRFESSAPDGTIVPLNKLCVPCSAFISSSALLQKLVRGSTIKIEASEVGAVGSPDQLKTGYHSGQCHLCALLWDRAGGHLLDPSRSARCMDYGAPVAVEIEARDDEKQMAITAAIEEDRARKLWAKFGPTPTMSEAGHIHLRIPVLNRDVYAELHIHRSSHPNLNREALGKTSISISSRHERNFEHIKNWRLQCSQTHTKCREFSGLIAPGGQLPSRLLDVTGNKVKLECQVQNLPPGVQYATLSHMWGDPSASPLRLIQATLEQFTSDIPLAGLPEKYVDAIRVTRALGFCYVWIDSLCIIQDSREDWETEALKMAAVYGRTACNISYTFPPGSEPSGNHLRDPRVHLPCQASLPPKGRAAAKATVMDSLVIQHRSGYLRPPWSPTMYKNVWPLLRRGWVYQERLLCPRTVYYGQDRLLWECCEGISDEFYGPMTIVPGSKVHFHRIITGISGSSRASSNDATTRQDQPDSAVQSSPTGSSPTTTRSDADSSTAETQWGPLVRDYRGASLTFESDRGIAFAGIARAIQAQGHLTYLAGLWRELFAYDLLWTVSPLPTNPGEFRRKQAESKPAPSWSWFSVPVHTSPLGTDILDFPFRTTMQTYKRFAVYHATVISFDHPRLETAPDALLHDFADMSVTLRTRRIPCTFKWWDAYLYVLPFGELKWMLGAKKNWIPSTNEWVSPRVLKYAHDDPLLGQGDKLPEGACMLLTVEHGWHHDTLAPSKEYKYTHRDASGKIPASWKTSYQYSGIVVVPAESQRYGNGCWRRIGAFTYGYGDDITGQSFITPFEHGGAIEEELVLI
ncbi:heterokaryon incompatibility protein-domain-containing protein [Lasiosphaeris hirsuta]|uniref:Heterokaryon incompatibility protein-domain-containing protein n=1 Tax=Lasiosphaeris hirsuta TaxID=260670 RepID=A0AA39ZRP0_9PEZI|nr:heterokaryon incompatibility protein-domain-containing protein [Lasiosphaeris hirsuta]